MEPNEPLPPIEPYTPNHIALAFHVPDMTGITNQELQAVRSHIQTASREARKKSNTIIGKIDDLRPLWMKTVGLGTHVTPEERKAIMDNFERALLRHPSAFVSYTLANSLIALDAKIRDELLRRTKLEPPKKK